MSSRIHAAALAALLFAVPAAAQSAGDAAAYNAMMLSPIAGVQHMPLLGADADNRTMLGFRYGATDAVGSTIHRTALAFSMPAGVGQLGFTGGVGFCDGCTSLVLLGADYLAPITRGAFQLGVRPALGVALNSGSESGGYYAGAVSLPLSWVDPEIVGVRFVPFIEPGVGFGGFSGSGTNENGTRAMLGGGLALSPDDGRYSLVLSAKRVFIDGARTNYGFGASFALPK